MNCNSGFVWRQSHTKWSLSSSIQWHHPLFFFSPFCSHTSLFPSHLTTDCAPQEKNETAHQNALQNRSFDHSYSPSCACCLTPPRTPQIPDPLGKTRCSSWRCCMFWWRTGLPAVLSTFLSSASGRSFECKGWFLGESGHVLIDAVD